MILQLHEKFLSGFTKQITKEKKEKKKFLNLQWYVMKWCLASHLMSVLVSVVCWLAWMFSVDGLNQLVGLNRLPCG